MAILPLNKLSGNLSGVYKTSCLWQISEWYLASGKNFKLKHITKNGLVILEEGNRKENCFLALIRKVSFLTIFLPVISTIIRTNYRKKYTFNTPNKNSAVTHDRLNKMVDAMNYKPVELAKKIASTSLDQVQKSPETQDFLKKTIEIFNEFYDLKQQVPKFDVPRNSGDSTFKDLTAVYGSCYATIFPHSPPPILDKANPCHQKVLKAWAFFKE